MKSQLFMRSSDCGKACIPIILPVLLLSRKSSGGGNGLGVFNAYLEHVPPRIDNDGFAETKSSDLLSFDEILASRNAAYYVSYIVSFFRRKT
jgi:hypothetical protein